MKFNIEQKVPGLNHCGPVREVLRRYGDVDGGVYKLRQNSERAEAFHTTCTYPYEKNESGKIIRSHVVPIDPIERAPPVQKKKAAAQTSRHGSDSVFTRADHLQ